MAVLTAGVVGLAAAGTGAQPSPRPEQRPAAAPAPAARMPDADALTTPAPPAIGATPRVAPPVDVPSPVPRTAAPGPAPAPAFPPPDPKPVVPAPVGAALRIVFDKAAAALPPDAAAGIDALAARMAATEAGRVQITAYADDPNAREARRLSLARAEAVRSRFVEKGVRAERINLRPLGDAGGDGPADRADILIVN